MNKEGVPTIAIPKTMDNDVFELYNTEQYRPKVRHVEGKPMFLY